MPSNNHQHQHQLVATSRQFNPPQAAAYSSRLTAYTATMDNAQPKLEVVARREPTITRPKDKPLLAPGIYEAYCRGGKVIWDKGYKRNECILQFDILHGDVTIAKLTKWFNLGSKRDKPHAGRRSKYLQDWVRANGGPPSRNDRLSPVVFARRMVTVKVGDTDPKFSPIPYSVVRELLVWKTGALSRINLQDSTFKEGKSQESWGERVTENAWQKIGVRNERPSVEAEAFNQSFGPAGSKDAGQSKTTQGVDGNSTSSTFGNVTTETSLCSVGQSWPASPLHDKQARAARVSELKRQAAKLQRNGRTSTRRESAEHNSIRRTQESQTHERSS